MKTSILHRLIRNVAVYHFLLCFVVCFVMEVKEVRGRTDLKTKLLLQNIRTHMAQKIDEIVKKKECEEGLTMCKNLKKDQEPDEEKSEEIPPPPKIIRGQHKPTIKVSHKDVIQTMLPKVHVSFHKKPVKSEDFEKQRKFLSSAEKSSEEKLEKMTEIKREKFIPKLSKSPIFEKPVEVKQLEKPHVKLLKPTQDTLKPEMKLKSQKIVTEDRQDKEIIKKDLWKKKEESKIKKKEIKDKKTKIDKKQEEDPLIFLRGSFVFGLEKPENSLCVKQSQVYLKNLKKLKTWALMMYDASAKVPSGIFQGNINQFGDFDECLSINAVFKKHKNKSREFSAIQGKYCLANADLDSEVETESFQKALERVKSFEFIKSNVDDPGHFIPKFSTVNWGVCVPSSCPAEDVEKFLKHHLQSFNESLGLAFKVKVEEENCVVKEDLKFQLQTGTLVTIILYLTVFLISLYATYLDMGVKQRGQIQTTEVSQEKPEVNAQGKVKNIIMAFSLSKNLRKLLQEKETKKCIECINGIKSIFTVVLYFAHKTIPLSMTPFCNRIFLTKVSNEPITVFMRASMVYTDSFLLMSGVLTSYNIARDISENRKVSWLKKTIDRFIRLTPASVAVVLFYSYVWEHLGSGPAWNSIVKKNSELCQKYFWRNFLFIQNFFPFEDMCAPQTHQLALDLQFSILAPLFVHLLHTYGKVGVGILQALFLISSIMRYITTANNELSVIIYHGMQVSQLYKTANLLYSQTSHRASPYILGTIVGYYLKFYERRINMSKIVVGLGWIVAAYFGYYSVLSPYNLASRDYRYNVQEAAQYAALSPVAWSLALSWVITACHLEHGGVLNQFLCQKIFLIFSRISYSIYLAQFLVFFYNVSIKRVPDVFTVTGSLNFPEFFVVVFFSTIVTLFFDIPIVEIKKIILYGPSKKHPQENQISEEVEKPEDLEGSQEKISRQDFEEITEELTEEGEEKYIEEEKIEENIEQDDLELVNDEEEEYLEEEDVEEEGQEGDDEDDENTTTFQLRLPKFRSRVDDDADDKDWLIVEPEKELNK